MRPMRTFAPALALLLSAACSAQMVLTTTFADNNGCAANYFDVEATGVADVHIVSFDGNFGASPVDIEIWTRPGTFVGFTGSPAGWTMVGSMTGMATMPAGTPTPIPIPINIDVLSGTRQAFLVQLTSGTSLRYTNGTAVGAAYASDMFLTFYEGHGDCATTPFTGSSFATRIWNGNIYYTVDCRGNCLNPEVLMPSVVGLPGSRSSVDSVVVDTSLCMTDNATPSCSAGGNDAFLRFTAPFDGVAVVDTCGPGTNFDTVLAVLEGGCTGTELDCNDNSTPPCPLSGLRSEITFSIVAGTDYFVLVDGVGGATGLADVNVQLTEIPTSYIPCTLPPAPQSLATPLATAILSLTLAPATGSGAFMSGISYNPCFDLYYGFQTGSPTAPWDVFDGMGTPVFSTTSVGLDGRSTWWNPTTGQMELMTFDALTGGATEGMFTLGLDVNAYPDGSNAQLLAAVPGLPSSQAAPAYNPHAGVLYARSGSDTVNVIDWTTGTMIGSFTLDSVSAGSPTFISESIGYTGVFGHEIVVGTVDSAVLFDLTGNYRGTVPLGMTLSASNRTGNYANDLFWVYNAPTGGWLGFELFSSSGLPVNCSTFVGGNLVLASGAHTIDTSAGTIDGVASPAFDGLAFNFTNIDIQTGATVTVSGGQPLILLADLNVTIDGTLDCSGGDGMPSSACNAPGGGGGLAGPGGFAGGAGGGLPPGTSTHDGETGHGPGGGIGGLDPGGGGGGSHMTAGTAGAGTRGGAPGATYSGVSLLVGGSGGGGGSADDDTAPPSLPVDPSDDGGAGGGGGGGAVRVVAGGNIMVGGTIDVSGGAGANTGCSGNSGSGGGGSGGVIELLAGFGMPTVTGTLNTAGGPGGTTNFAGGNGGSGWTNLGTTTCTPTDQLLVTAQPQGSQMIDSDATGVAALAVALDAIGLSIDFNSFTLDASGTGDDSIAITDVAVYEDADSSHTLTPGDVLLVQSSGPFPADDGQLVLMLGTPRTVVQGTPLDLVFVYDLGGTAMTGETFQLTLSALNVTTPGIATSGVPATGDLLSINAPVITHVTGTFSPAPPVPAANGDLGVVLLQTELTSVGAEGVITSLDLVASGSGDDVAGVALVQLVQEDPATINGVVDGLDSVIGSGTYPVNNGTLTLMPTINVPLGVTVSLIVVYDFTTMASGATPPSTYTVTVTNLVSNGSVMTPGGVPAGTAEIGLRCPVLMCGDCNGDSLVTIVDALVGAQHAVGIITLSGTQFSNCNVQGVVEPLPGAVVDTLDALTIAQFAAGLPVTIGCCVP